MKVIVAIWDHRHGQDIRVFDSEDGAKRWQREIAEEWWEKELGNEPKPEDPQEMADAYFELMEGRDEFFSYGPYEVETDPQTGCGNCGWAGRQSQLKPIQDIFERVAPGEIMPAGECPECGALAHLKK
jgi:hypothetical protein